MTPPDVELLRKLLERWEGRPTTTRSAEAFLEALPRYGFELVKAAEHAPPTAIPTIVSVANAALDRIGTLPPGDALTYDDPWVAVQHIARRSRGPSLASRGRDGTPTSHAPICRHRTPRPAPTISCRSPSAR